MKKFSPNLTDQELHELFKQAAETYEPRYRQDEKQEQWEKIALQLSAQKIPEQVRKSGSYRWRRITFILLLGALLFGAGEVFIGSMMEQKKITNVKSEKAESKTNDYKQPRSDRNTANIKMIPENKIAELNKIKTKNDLTVSKPSPHKNLKTIFNVQKINSATETRQHYEISKLLKHNDTNNITDDTSQHRITRKKSLPKWSIGITAGTDWSGVKTKINGRTALDVGIIIQRRLSRRWSVESGLLLTSKLYSAGPADYTSAVSYPALFRVDAECRIFDLPINLRYDALQRNDHIGFVSAGISSIWMQRENYLLRSKVNGMVQTAEYNYYNDNKHLFSIVNLSAGYEHAWSRFGLQVAPYLKLPLKGIGAGEVKLASAGVLVSAKYSFK
jgi:hypothetical protein